jgi:signal transduction histidine kinase
MIVGYYDALASALTNVLLNAVDACNGKGTITVDATITTLGQQDAVRIGVADTGPGIDPEQLRRMWDPYVTQKAGGTGLGLTIARQAVWAHHGTVNAESTVGVGTRIEFTLPVGTSTESRSDV